MPTEAASGLWRSEDMVLLQFHMQRESAHDNILKLGELGMVQFWDMNQGTNAFQRDFANEIRRCEDMDRKLRYLQEEILKNSIVSLQKTGMEAESLNTLERKVEEKDHEVHELSSQLDALVAEKNRTQEHLEVLMRDQGNSEHYPTGLNIGAGGLAFITGVIVQEKAEGFARLIFRATRGNSFLRTEEITHPFLDPVSKNHVYKSVFTIFFSSKRIYEKLKKICESVGATVYTYAERRDELLQLRNDLHQQLDTLGDTFSKFDERHRQLLTQVGQEIHEWRRAVITEKGIYAVMNMLQFQGSTVIGRGWCPASEMEHVQRALRMGEHLSGAQVSTIVEQIETKATRPTFFKTNKFTSIFQGIVDSYGIARYKEVNPGVWTVITFPYLFGVMYGDIGHGIMLTIAAAFMIFMERHFEGKPLSEMFAMVFGGRYLLFFMGLFGTYIGILYNDMFGLSTEIFKSAYTWPALPSQGGPEDIVTPTHPNGDPANARPGISNVKPDTVVSVGIDSAWAETENKLEFYNSVKMKCAVIIGIVQMSLGVFLSLLNHLHFKDQLSVYYRFVPEIVFITCTFGYMALMIILKWVTPWPNTNVAPSLLETMTNFFLAPGTVSVELYSGQAYVQVFLLLISFSMVPILLGGIPYYKKKEHEEKMQGHRQGQSLVEMNTSHTGSDAPISAEDEEEEFDFSEIMIHQTIHTIEYVLGCVSNTASYLRLWALSLAHAQLSEVFLNFAFLKTVSLDTGSGVFIFIGFAVWLSATIGVLLMMEALSAFLHSLRLHWVEFQSKFYAGDGVQFAPFDIAELLQSL